MRPTKKIPEVIKDYLGYDPSTGILVWKQKPCRPVVVGQRIICKDKNGYIVLGFRGVQYFAHRVAYFLYTGEQIPAGQILDHVNRVTDDNRWTNLRLATYRQNRAYSVQGGGKYGAGVEKLDSGRFRARIEANGRKRIIGIFSSPEDAAYAYQIEFNGTYGPEWNIRSLASA